MTTFICVSASRDQAAQLQADGPRRDFVALAAAVDGETLFASNTRAKGLIGRLTGPHLRQAWATARRARAGDTVFADGEHIGIPLLGFLAATGRRRVRVVMLGHLVTRRWKRLLFRLTSRLVPAGVVVVHSEVQAHGIRRVLGRGWEVKLVPYQVDTSFWRSASSAPPDGPIIAVGSENRDYETLAAAVGGLDRKVIIAAGSHWARTLAGSSELPANVEYRSTAMSFADLRDAYAAASLVVMPLQDVDNQSGVTGILEAMSMGRPVVVTASNGQRECITGPLVRDDGTLDRAAMQGRGPQVFGGGADGQATGLYALPADPASLRAAIEYALADHRRACEMAIAARCAAERHFSFERYVETLATILKDAQRISKPIPVVAEA